MAQWLSCTCCNVLSIDLWYAHQEIWHFYHYLSIQCVSSIQCLCPCGVWLTYLNSWMTPHSVYNYCLSGIYTNMELEATYDWISENGENFCWIMGNSSASFKHIKLNYWAWETCLIYTQMLMTFLSLKFNNFFPEHDAHLKFLSHMHQSLEGLLKLTELL